MSSQSGAWDRANKIIILIYLFIFTALPAFAVQVNGHKGVIGKKEILSILDKNTFDEDVYIDGYVISGDHIIDIINTNPDLSVNIKHSIIVKGLNFQNLSLLPLNEPNGDRERKFQKFREVKNEIRIMDSEIQSFDKYRKGKGVKLSIDAGDTIFYNNVLFQSVKFNNRVLFKSAVFASSVNFTSSVFTKKANFIQTEFSGYADFTSAIFTGAVFTGAVFSDLSYFKDAVFLDLLKIGDAKFKGYADFRDTGIRRLDFKALSPNIITIPLDFRNAKISEAHFQDIIFEKDVDFSDAKFGAYEQDFAGFTGPLDPLSLLNHKADYSLVFRYVTFKSNADFIRTKFFCNTGFEMVKFRDNANFKDAVFKHADIDNKFWFAYIDFSKLIIKWDQLPAPGNIIKYSGDKVKSFLENKEDEKPQQLEYPGKIYKPEKYKPEKYKPDHLKNLSDFFQSLEANFRTQKQLSDANKAYYYMKRLKLQAARTGEKVPEWNNIKIWLMAEIERIVWGVPCGYGTKIGRIAAWIIFFHLLFTIIYYKKGELLDLTTTTIKEDDDKDCIPVTDNKKRTKLKMASRLSLAVLLKIESKSVGITGNICNINSKQIERFERWLGFYLVFCLLITSSNTFPLINRLLEGVF
ncbi:hypothetical protein QUF70_15855 [Desulfobacterales bacterium HSG17]|nr:hypothetical protein [Desulfobacterales bacterium HSG17]